MRLVHIDILALGLDQLCNAIGFAGLMVVFLIFRHFMRGRDNAQLIESEARFRARVSPVGPIACPQCGAPIAPAAAFCGRCGLPVGRPPVVLPHRKTSLLLFYIIISLMGAIGLAAYLFFARDTISAVAFAA